MFSLELLQALLRDLVSVGPLERVQLLLDVLGHFVIHPASSTNLLVLIDKLLDALGDAVPLPHCKKGPLDVFLDKT